MSEDEQVAIVTRLLERNLPLIGKPADLARTIVAALQASKVSG